MRMVGGEQSGMQQTLLTLSCFMAEYWSKWKAENTKQGRDIRWKNWKKRPGLVITRSMTREFVKEKQDAREAKHPEPRQSHLQGSASKPEDQSRDVSMEEI
ncbi:uncharacterized protein PAC_12553 [Phialocephala subalpina]|uniref:Uncharacterized protein n=1 Tax=Phialocephala subalpina TaxID=576137 RepID=A0A1L7XCD2_9HELO|nr:uncharacterized protein PAC_12553 [Phialocephala subalpina]